MLTRDCDFSDGGSQFKCRAVCRHFAKGGGGGGELGVFKKEGAQLQEASGGALEDNVKNEFCNFKGGQD